MLHLFIRTDLRSNGVNEFNEEIDYTEYSIIAQDDTGIRMRLNTSVLNNLEKSDRECRNIQSNRILKIQSCINAGIPLNPEFWSEIDPVYGSDAYLNKQREESI